MYGCRHLWLIPTILCVVLANGSSASAQAWLSDRQRAQGHGIRLGDLEFHPGLGAEAGYVSNMYYSERPDASAVMRVSPHLFVSTLTAERSTQEDRKVRPGLIAFNGGLAASYQHFFAQLGPRDAFGTDLGLQLTLAPERPIGLVISETLNRAALPFSDTSQPTSTASPTTNFTRYNENAGAQLIVQSSGGLLKAGLGYNFGYIWFDDARFGVNDNMTHTASLNLAWEFLPKTALFYEGTFLHQAYENANATSGAVLTNRIDNNRVSGLVGLNGAITARIGATAAIGYAAGFYRGSSTDFEGLIGRVEARYTPTATSQLALVFDRGFLPSYQGNYQDRMRVYSQLRWLFTGSLMMSAKLGIEFLRFGTDATQGNRDDRRYFGELSGEYRFVDWLALTAQGNLLIDDTAFVFKAPGLPSNPAKFNAYEGWLGLRAFY